MEDTLKHGHMIGEWQDKITNVETGEVTVLPWQRNLVVNTIGNLIAARFFGNTGGGDADDKPISYWAIGSGNPSWDTVPGIPSVTDTILVAEFARKLITPSEMTYLDAGDLPTVSNTNKLQIILTFGTSEANGTWREFGIFGGNATAVLDTGLMINHKIHGSITKTVAIAIERTIRFTF